MTISDLPLVNASLNGLSALFLVAGYVFIRRGNREAHRRCMGSAVFTSAVFLVSYLTYHFSSQVVTRFKDPAWFRPIYLLILLSHTLLAVAVLPLVLLTVRAALTERFAEHRRLARWTWPIWLYVSITGVVIYLLLYQVFPQR